MFLVCDPIVWGEEHVPFNASFLRTIVTAFPNETVLFLAEEAHVKGVQNHIGNEYNSSINWESIVLPQRHSSFFSRFFTDFKIVQTLFKTLQKSENNTLVITGSPSILWALKLSAIKLKESVHIQVILHGVLASLVQHRHTLKSRIRALDPLLKLQSIRTALKLFINKRIQFIVLEESIRKAVLNELPALQPNIAILDHPVPFNEQNLDDHKIRLPVQIGFLGRTSGSKGFKTFLNVASDIAVQFPDKVNFHVIGRSVNGYIDNSPEMIFLKTLPAKKRISREEYITQLHKLDYICMFYDHDYRFTASGVLLDCIAFKKPIIATRIPIFQDLQNRYGDIGYLCNMDEFSRTIITLLKNIDQDRYMRQVGNMDKIRTSRTPEILAAKYYDLVNNLQSNIKKG